MRPTYRGTLTVVLVNFEKLLDTKKPINFKLILFPFWQLKIKEFFSPGTLE